MYRLLFFKAIISSVKNLLSNISLVLAKQCDRSCRDYKIKCKRTFASFKELKIEIRNYDSCSSTQATIESCKVNVLRSLWMELGPYLPKWNPCISLPSNTTSRNLKPCYQKQWWCGRECSWRESCLCSYVPLFGKYLLSPANHRVLGKESKDGNVPILEALICNNSLRACQKGIMK